MERGKEFQAWLTDKRNEEKKEDALLPYVAILNLVSGPRFVEAMIEIASLLHEIDLLVEEGIDPCTDLQELSRLMYISAMVKYSNENMIKMYVMTGCPISVEEYLLSRGMSFIMSPYDIHSVLMLMRNVEQC